MAPSSSAVSPSNTTAQVEGDKYANYSNSRDNRLVMKFKPTRIMRWDFAHEDDDHQAWGYTRNLGT